MISELSLKDLFHHKSLRKTAVDVAYQQILESLKFQFDKLWARNVEPSVPPVGFDLIRVLGSGAFGQVVLGKHKITSVHYAIKIQEKAMLVRLKQIEHAYYEKKILQTIAFPLVVNMDFSFKDANYIYFVMPFVNGGDMFTFLRKVTKFKDDICRFYAAQIVLALEYLHFVNLVYRDLKPENVMIDSSGYLKLCDFGFCKYVTTRTWSFCGTPDYLAPEVIKSMGYGQNVDWWALGVLMYEMSAGYPPFHHDDEMAMFDQILSLTYRFPNGFSVALRDLIRNLLQVDLSRRYGGLKKGVYDIKYHKYFNGVNWMDIYEQNIRAPYIPLLRNESDARHFDTNEEIIMNQEIGEKYENEFKDF